MSKKVTVTVELEIEPGDPVEFIWPAVLARIPADQVPQLYPTRDALTADYYSAPEARYEANGDLVLVLPFSPWANPFPNPGS